MARIRTLKPEFWANERLSELPEAVHMLAAALLNHADDDGYFNANPLLVKAACFPLRTLTVEVEDALHMLKGIDYLDLLTGTDGRTYGLIRSFKAHQRVSRPSESKIAPLIIGRFSEGSVNAHGGLTEPSMLNGSGREAEGEWNGIGAEGEAEGEGESEGKPSAPPGQPPLNLSGVDWDWVIALAERVAKSIPAMNDQDRRAWIRYAVLAWTTFSEAWLLDAVEAVLQAKSHKRSRQAHLVGVLKAKAVEEGTESATLMAMMKRIEIPSEVWKSEAVRIHKR